MKLLPRVKNKLKGKTVPMLACAFLASSAFAQTASYTPQAGVGWNLLGNSVNTAVAASSLFGDAAKVNAVWKWDATAANLSGSGWQVYAPSMTATELAAFAASKGYGVLTQINPGEGYWVNAKVATSFAAQTGAAAKPVLTAGWNLVATGNDVTPSAFNASLSATPPAAGTVPSNVTTIWAWDNATGKWYFYAPSLEAQGGTALASYTTSKGLLNFTTKKLGNGTGFWANISGIAADWLSTTTTSTTGTTGLTSVTVDPRVVMANVTKTATPVAVTLSAQPVAPGPTGTWQTAEALKIIDPSTLQPSLQLIAQLDSSGADAWTPPAHGVVYFSTDGMGYGGLVAKDFDPRDRSWVANVRPYADDPVPSMKSPKWQGVALIDGVTKLPLAVKHYPDLGPSPLANAAASENHGMAVSPDGKWIYTQGNDSRSIFATKDVLNVINARTLKVDKVIQSRVHHVRTFTYGWPTDANGNADPLYGKGMVLVDGWNNQFYVLDPSNDNKVVKAVSPTDLAGAGYLGHVDYAGKYLFITTRTGFGTHGGVIVISLKTMKPVIKINTDDSSAIWTTFSANGKYAYVTSGHHSRVVQIDMSNANPGNWRVVKNGPAMAAGPYGITMNWGDTTAIVAEKHEGSGNRGDDMSVVPAGDNASGASMAGANGYGQIYLNGCIRLDHHIMHPNPMAVDATHGEMWGSCNSSMENVVVAMDNTAPKSSPGMLFDTKYYVVKSNIGTYNPLGNVPSTLDGSSGSSHGGSFVKYNADWTGEVQTDTNGYHGAALVEAMARAKAAGNGGGLIP